MRMEFWTEIIRLEKAPFVTDEQAVKLVAYILGPLSRAGLDPLALETLKQSNSLGIVFVDEVRGRELNLQFRGRDYATDVLSFAPVEKSSLGELVFCVPVLNKQAKEHDLTPLQEFIYLLIHGILHLLGYDHEKNDKEARDMYRLQDKLFESLRESSLGKSQAKKSQKKPAQRPAGKKKASKAPKKKKSAAKKVVQKAPRKKK